MKVVLNTVTSANFLIQILAKFSPIKQIFLPSECVLVRIGTLA